MDETDAMAEVERAWRVLGVRTGHLSIDEWDGYWRASESDRPPTAEEYDAVYSQLSDWLEAFLRDGGWRKDDCYVRGDNYGHRTQFVDTLHRKVITIELIDRLQQFLRQSQYSNWRIVVLTYLERDEIPVIYPDAVRLGRRFDGMSFAQALADIRSRMEPG